MGANWYFLGGEGVKMKNLLWEEYGYFLGLHIPYSSLRGSL